MAMLALLTMLLMNLENIHKGLSDPCPFRVTCTQNKKMLELQGVSGPVKLLISQIDYRLQSLEAYDPENCLPSVFLRLNYSSNIPFQSEFREQPNKLSFFDCSSVGQRHLRSWDQIQDDAQDMISCPIYAAFSDASAIVGSIVLGLLLGAIFQIYSYFRMKGEDDARVENFLKDYRALKPTRFSYADIKRITHQFKEKLGEGAHGAVYKGEENFQVLYPDWIHSLLEGRDIHIPIDEEGDFRIAKKLAIVGLWCIQWHPVHRPSMKTVVQMLQGEEDKLKVPRNPFGPTDSLTNTSANSVAGRLNLELEVIEELD
ncbi:receptor-like protein kinase [Sesbania bispinosa]|nr:receptor-like protein kinase [Sesbania bispinosa]